MRRRGKALLLSPLDWALMESWKEREIPLHVVLRGIEQVFDTYESKPNQKRTIKGLSYCREEVEAQFAEWAERQVGKAADTEDDSPVDVTEDYDGHLVTVSDALKAALPLVPVDVAEVFERVVTRLDGLRGNFENAEKLEQSLDKLDQLIDDALLTTVDADLSASVDAKMEAYRGKMDAGVFATTRNLMIVKALRERHGVPRLSLFYL